LPDDGRGRVDLLAACGRAGAQPRRRQGRLDHVGGPHMASMVAGALGAVDPPLPVLRKARHGLGRPLTIALRDLPPQGLTRGLALRIGHGTAQRAGLGRLCLGDRLQHGPVRTRLSPAAMES
jgi:hypothetical protein